VKGENTVNIYKAVVLIILFVMVYCAAVQAESVDKIIAVVNEEIITLNEFNTAFEPYRKRIEETYRGNDKDGVIKETKAAFLGRLIDNLLIEQEAKKSGASIKIKDEEVMGALKDMLAKQNVKLEDFLKKLEKEGDSLESVKDELRGQLMRMRLMRWEIRSKIMVSDQEIGDFYNQHREEYEGKEAVRIKQILLMIPQNADRATKIKIKEDARQIQKKALSGESFDLLAAKYSQGPGADQGGDIGFIERGVTIPELEKAAFSLLVDQVSPVIESSLGFHIIKVVEKRGAGLKPIAAVREEIKTKLEDVKLEKKYDEWISSVRKKSFIEIR
jgi:peptidyl-prolyl cis-trans isomerase SurA